MWVYRDRKERATVGQGAGGLPGTEMGAGRCRKSVVSYLCFRSSRRASCPGPPGFGPLCSPRGHFL